MSSLVSEDIVFGEEAEIKGNQYICPACGELLKDAVQTKCEHHLCEKCAEMICIDQALCPKQNCQKKLTNSQYSPDYAVRRKVDNLQTICPIGDCHWMGAYKDYQSHQAKEHPPALLQTVPRRRGSHALVTIKDQQIIDSTPQKLRDTAHQLQQSANDLLQRAESMEKVSEGAEYVERLSADSLRRYQTGASASSNKSLKRADNFKMFSEAQSNTLDASTANDQIHFETTAQIEHTAPTAQVSQQQGQLVAGTTRISRHLSSYSDDNQPTSSFLPPLPNPLSREEKNQSTSQKYSAPPEAASAQSVPPRTHQRKKVPPSLPPLTIKNPTQVASAQSSRQSPNKVPTLSPFQATTPINLLQPLSPNISSDYTPPFITQAPPTNPLQPLSPNAPSQAPPFSTQAPPTNVLYKPAPPSVPPPFILRARNLPIPSSVRLPTSPRAKQSMATPNADCLPTSPKAKSNTMPGVTGGCTNPDCIANTKKIQVLTGILLKETLKNTGCVHCNKENNKRFGRGRFQSV